MAITLRSIGPYVPTGTTAFGTFYAHPGSGTQAALLFLAAQWTGPSSGVAWGTGVLSVARVPSGTAQVASVFIGGTGVTQGISPNQASHGTLFHRNVYVPANSGDSFQVQALLGTNWVLTGGALETVP